MMKTLKILAVAVLITTTLAVIVFAASTPRTASVTEFRGAVEVRLGAQGKWLPAKTGMILTQGSAIRTKANSMAILELDGKAKTAKVEMKENSQLSFAELVEDKTQNTQKTLLDLSVGKVMIQVNKLRAANSKFEVKTPTSIVGVRGTTFAVAVEAVETLP